MMQMADIEIDGDMSSANILFRGKSLFTKTLELYLRLVGTDFLHASVGATVSALCAERIDIEIDPSKLRGGPMERTLAENKQDLERWTTYLWNTLYQARHKCPKCVHLYRSLPNQSRLTRAQRTAAAFRSHSRSRRDSVRRSQIADALHFYLGLRLPSLLRSRSAQHQALRTYSTSSRSRMSTYAHPHCQNATNARQHDGQVR